jgi:hypothetical protein
VIGTPWKWCWAAALVAVIGIVAGQDAAILTATVMLAVIAVGTTSGFPLDAARMRRCSFRYNSVLAVTQKTDRSLQRNLSGVSLFSDAKERF